MTGPTATRRAAVAAMVVALVPALTGAAVAFAVTGGADRTPSAVTASVDPPASDLDGHAARPRVAAHDQPEAAVAVASSGVSAGQGRAATTEAAKEMVE